MTKIKKYDIIEDNPGISGLTFAEVREKQKQKAQNRPVKPENTYLRIFAQHLFTPFNAINLILACLVAYTGSLRNLLFICIAAANTVIGAINEIRAKSIVAKLALVSAARAKVVRESKSFEIPAEELVVGDVIKLGLGDQISVDAKIISGRLEVNESLVTGESSAVERTAGEKLISGSFVVSGSAYAEVVAVGSETHAAALQKEAKDIKTAKSELFTTLNKIISTIGLMLIPVGALLFASQYHATGDLNSAILSVVAALVAMIPEGLYLLTSSVLALSTVRLARKNVLTQDLYAVETLARVDTICLDKTGTITTGNLKFEKIVPLENHDNKEITEALNILSTNLASDTPTMKSIAKYLNDEPQATVKVFGTLPFSSSRKTSGVKTEDGWFYLGAPEFILKEISGASSAERPETVASDGNNKNESAANSAYAKILKTAETLAENYRVLGVARNGEFLGFILLSDEIRESAAPLLKFFAKEDVEVKIISGDNPKTVEKIVSSVGLENPKSIDLSSKKSEDYSEIVKNYNIFARVTPEQKRELTKALQAAGHTVAMTGDGVNDILAMKEADCSIAIGSGTDAAREVAKFVLLDSDFSRIPAIIREGRRSINNLERSATLFLAKTTYATLLSVSFVFLGIFGLRYPFIPIEMTLLNTLTIGIPAFVLALEPNHEQVKEGNLQKNIKKYSLPTGLTIFALAVILSIFAKIFNLTSDVVTTLSALIVFSVGISLVYRISKPLTPRRRALIYALILLFVLALLIHPLARFFGFIVIN